MKLFKRKKKQSSCCAIQFEELKPEVTKGSSCCDMKIEEVKDTEARCKDKLCD